MLNTNLKKALKKWILNENSLKMYLKVKKQIFELLFSHNFLISNIFKSTFQHKISKKMIIQNFSKKIVVFMQVISQKLNRPFESFVFIAKFFSTNAATPGWWLTQFQYWSVLTYIPYVNVLHKYHKIVYYKSINS